MEDAIRVGLAHLNVRYHHCGQSTSIPCDTLSALPKPIGSYASRLRCSHGKYFPLRANITLGRRIERGNISRAGCGVAEKPHLYLAGPTVFMSDAKAAVAPCRRFVRRTAVSACSHLTSTWAMRPPRR